MNTKGLEKIYKAAWDNKGKFIGPAKYFVEKYVGPVEGGTLSEASRLVIAECSATDMYIGAQLVKNRYLLTGAVLGGAIGIASTMLVLKLRKDNSKEEEA